MIKAPRKDVIPLPIREHPPKIVIVDDETIIKKIKDAWQEYYPQALDIRSWQPTDSLDLLTQLKQWQEQEQWRLDVIVIDIDHTEDGGLHYLNKLRAEQGYAALAVVLATGKRYNDLVEGAGATPKPAKDAPPEAILYGKTADDRFLGRVGEHIEDWKLIARRRAWLRLLQQVSEQLDGASVKAQVVGDVIVKFMVHELGVDSAFVRRRLSDGQYELVAMYPEQGYVEVGNKINIEEVPLLAQIVTLEQLKAITTHPEEKRGLRDPVISHSITKAEAGKFKKKLIGKRFLGIGAVLGERSAGFITLLRDQEHPEFAQEDKPFLIVLARLLASALRVTFLREMQKGLLEFAQQAAQASDARQVCIELAKTLHKELHDNSDNESKTTVRLLDFATGELIRQAHFGLAVNNTQIFLKTHYSNYAEVIDTNKVLKIEDVTASETFLETSAESGVIHSELCVPLSSGGTVSKEDKTNPIGGSAIGAVNLEHKTKDFYRKHDIAFVLAATTLAANAIERIRKNKLLEGMTEFALNFAATPYQNLETQLHDLLYEFCGFSVLVDLEKPQQARQPWQIHAINCHYQNSNEEEIRSELESHCLNPECWGNTWASRLISNAKAEAEDEDGAWFTDNPKDFTQINLTRDATLINPGAKGGAFANNTPIKALALLLIKRNHAEPHRAFLLMWALPPPMNTVDIKRLLGKLARLFSELDDKKQQVQTLTQEKLLSEQAVNIAHVMQHFRHRLGSLTGGLSNNIDRVEQAHQNKPARFQGALRDLRDNAQEIADSFHKSNGYIKEPKMQKVAVCTIAEKSCNDLNERLQTQNPKLSINIAEQLIAYTDLDIASLVLYSLLENALDATKGNADATLTINAKNVGNYIELQVIDNGCGVSQDFQSKLFQWGETTKSTKGLGSALSFARTRMALMQGQLLFPLPQPEQGALFEMQLALPPAENSHD